MFELVAAAKETRVPALGDAPQIAVSSDSGAELLAPERMGNLTLLISGEVVQKVVRRDASQEFFDEHYANYELLRLERKPSAGCYVAAAIVFLQTGRGERALELLTEARERFHDYWIEHYYGIALCELGRFTEAISSLRQLADSRSTDWRPRHAQGRAELLSGDVKSAAITLTQAANLPDASATVFSDLATVLLKQGQLRDAKRALRQSLARDPFCTLAHNNMGVCHQVLGVKTAAERATRSFITALECDPHCAPAVHNLAESYIASNEFGKAVELLEPFVQTHPGDVHATERLAWAHYKLGTAGRAVALLRAAASIQNAPARDSLLNNLGIIHRARGESRSAEIAFSQALESGSRSIQVRINYGLLLDAQQRWRDILLILPESLALQHPGAALLRATSLVFTGAVDEGRAFLTRVLELDPENQMLRASLGYVLSAFLNAHESAIRILRDNRPSKKPAHPMLANNLAYALVQSGRLHDAREILEPNLSEFEDDASPIGLCLRATWGLMLIREGAYEAGIAYYRKALAAASGRLAERLRQRILLEEGRQLLRAGQREFARRKLEKVVKADAFGEFSPEATKLLHTMDAVN